MENLLKGGDPQERRLIIARFLQRVGGESSYFVGILGYAAYDLHASAALIAIIMLFFNGAMMLGSMVAGFFVDRMGPRRVLLGAQVSIFATAVALQFIGKSVPLFIALSALMGVTLAHFNTGFASLGPYLVKGTDELKRFNSRIEVASYAASIVGPLVGAAIVSNAPTIRVFLFNAVMTVASAAFMWKFTERFKPERREEQKHPLYEIKRGFQLVLSEKTLIFFLIANILVFFAFGAFDSLESLYYKDVVGVGVEWMGYVNSAIGFGLLIGAFALGRFKARHINITMLSLLMLLEGLGTLVYVGTSSIVVVVIGGLILGFAFGAAEPLMRTLIQAVSPLQYIGRVTGVMQLVRNGGSLIPLLLAPGLSDTFGVQAVLVGAAVLTSIASFSLLPFARRLDAQTADTLQIDQIDPFADGEETSLREPEMSLSGEGADLHAALGRSENRKDEQ